MGIQEHTQKQSSANMPASQWSNGFATRGFSAQKQPDKASGQQPPDLKTQLQRAARFGPSLNKLNLPSPSPVAALQTKAPATGQGNQLIQRQEEEEDREPMKLNQMAQSAIQRQEGLEGERQEEQELVQTKPDARSQSERPKLQAQYERAKRFGHHLGQTSVYASSANQKPPALQTKESTAAPLTRSGVVQRRLAIGQPGDRYEQEADRVAEQVMAMNAPAKPDAIQRFGEEQEEQEPVQTKPLAADITPLIQRQEQEEQEQGQLQPARQPAADGSVATSSNLESQLKGTKGGGSPLPDSARNFMEPRVGTDFSGVRVHTDNSAVQMNRDLNAQAFTHGQDVYFGAGKYNPESNDGKRLLAHELTHVVQQTGAKQLQRKPGNGLRSNKETRQAAKDHPAPAINSSIGSLLQLKQSSKSAPKAHTARPAPKPTTTSAAKPQSTQSGSTATSAAKPQSTQSGSTATSAAKPQSTQSGSGAATPAKQQSTQSGSGDIASTTAHSTQSGSGDAVSTTAHSTQSSSGTTTPSKPQSTQSGSGDAASTTPHGTQTGSGDAASTTTHGTQTGSGDAASTIAEDTPSGSGVKSRIAEALSNSTPTSAQDTQSDDTEAIPDDGGMAAPSDSTDAGAQEDQSDDTGAIPDDNGMAAPSDATEQADGNDGGQSPASPEQDPAFQAVAQQTAGVAGQQRTHEPAETGSQQAQEAAKGPANEVESQAQGNQVQEMDQQQPGEFNAEAFKKALMDKIADSTPKNLQDADNFKNNNKLDSVKQDMSSQVSQQKQQSQGAIEEKTKEKPNTSGLKPKPVTALPPQQPGPKPPTVDAAASAPKPKSNSEISLQAGSKSIDHKMASADITDEQLAKSNEPSFQSAIAAKKTAQTDAATAPAAYRQQEQGTLSQAQDQAQTATQKHMEEMHGTREQVLTQVAGHQDQTKGQDEQERAQVANQIQGIYSQTKKKVEDILNQLDGQVNKLFDDGATAAQKQFEDYVGKKMDAYKKERYSGFWGPGRWLVDKLFGMPGEVNKFYDEGRQQYLDSMGQTIDNVANLVATQLNAAKAEIANGKQEVQKYVASLPQSLQQVGQEAAQNIQDQFDQLQQEVNDKQDDLVDQLAQKYNDNLKQLDARIDEMKEENKGLVQKAIEFVVSVVTTIAELAKMLAQALARAASAIPTILKDPIGFVKNLFAGLKQGFQNFMNNIKQHLLDGLLGWLTGTLASNIQMPQSLDLEGIFSLVAQVLGLTYDAIRAKAVERLGEEKVSKLEGSFQMFQVLATQGVVGLWQFVKDKIGDLKSMVIDAIENIVIQEVIKAGIEWLLSMLNPASAFVRACKAIIDVVEFFMSHAQQIAELINAIVDAILAIAKGSGLDQVAQLVENALAKAIPVVISFLTSLLGLGDITQKVQGIINKARKPIDKAVDWVIDEGEKAVGSVGNKLGNTGSGKKGKGKQGTDQKQDPGRAGPLTAKSPAPSAPPNEQDPGRSGSHTAKPPAPSTPGVKPSTPATKPPITKPSAPSPHKAGSPTAKPPASSSSNKDKHKGKDGNSKDGRTEQQKKADLNKALAEAQRLMEDKKLSFDDVEKHLPKIKSKYKMKSCKLVIDKETKDTTTAHVVGEINPISSSKTVDKSEWKYEVTKKGTSTLYCMKKEDLPEVSGLNWEKVSGKPKNGKPGWTPTLNNNKLEVPRDCMLVAEIVSAWLNNANPEEIHELKLKDNKPTIKPAVKNTKVNVGDIMYSVHDQKTSGSFHGAAVIATDGPRVVTMEGDSSEGETLEKMRPIFDIYEGHAGFNAREQGTVYVIKFKKGRDEKGDKLWPPKTPDGKPWQGDGIEVGNKIIEMIKQNLNKNKRKQPEDTESEEMESEKKKRKQDA